MQQPGERNGRTPGTGGSKTEVEGHLLWAGRPKVRKLLKMTKVKPLKKRLSGSEN